MKNLNDLQNRVDKISLTYVLIHFLLISLVAINNWSMIMSHQILRPVATLTCIVRLLSMRITQILLATSHMLILSHTCFSCVNSNELLQKTILMHDGQEHLHLLLEISYSNSRNSSFVRPQSAIICNSNPFPSSYFLGIEVHRP